MTMHALGLGYAVEPVAQQGALGSGEHREVGERRAQGHCRGPAIWRAQRRAEAPERVSGK